MTSSWLLGIVSTVGVLPLSTRARQVCFYKIVHPGLGTIRLEFKQNVMKDVCFLLLLLCFVNSSLHRKSQVFVNAFELHRTCMLLYSAVNPSIVQILRIDWEWMNDDVEIHVTSFSMMSYGAICTKILVDPYRRLYHINSLYLAAKICNK